MLKSGISSPGTVQQAVDHHAEGCARQQQAASQMPQDGQPHGAPALSRGNCLPTWSTDSTVAHFWKMHQ